MVVSAKLFSFFFASVFLSLLKRKKKAIGVGVMGGGDDKVREQVAYAVELMESIMDDTSVPRNIRKTIEDAKLKVTSGEAIEVAVTSAIYLLEDISNDINMPAHTRTEIWTIISELESIREKNK